MLVIHWTTHNKTGRILANGIRPSNDRRISDAFRFGGVYVYPYARNKTLAGNWRRQLKACGSKRGNYNGFVFRLTAADFPLIAGYWFANHQHQRSVRSLEELSALYADFFSGKILTLDEDRIPYNWRDFEIIIPTHIAPNRIMTVLMDRKPGRVA